jgi:hypothetical protein
MRTGAKENERVLIDLYGFGKLTGLGISSKKKAALRLL